VSADELFVADATYVDADADADCDDGNDEGEEKEMLGRTTTSGSANRGVVVGAGGF